jgi:hypothetical protein
MGAEAEDDDSEISDMAEGTIYQEFADDQAEKTDGDRHDRQHDMTHNMQHSRRQQEGIQKQQEEQTTIKTKQRRMRTSKGRKAS